MPVILGDKDSVDTWLDDPSASKLQPLLAPYEKSDLVWYPVTSAIGKLSFDGPECIQQVRFNQFPLFLLLHTSLRLKQFWCKQIPLKASQNSLISKFFSAKQPKTEEREKETRSTGPKEEPILEGVLVSDSNDDEIKQVDEEKAEALVGESSAIASHPESVKKEVEEGTYGEGESVETGGRKRDYELFSAQEKPWKQQQSVVVRLQDDKSCGKHGRKKQGKGNSKETQSTLHFFFDEK
ncbi:hypothetical protein F2Q70_00041301 [Brassica cretica]|uniref:Embryonic stem cell-specific 5-hydroxymethylcytosine-binding protein n=1 Tax=Brassica cretica TaxID=69181 RepID=A0A8S9K4C4_BRACR|nr:hypothetical protein F2Q70_00041301 [Brassica cretica]